MRTRIVRAVTLLSLVLAGALGAFSAQAAATPATLYWSGETAVGSVQVDDTTGVLVGGTRNDSTSTGCGANAYWTWGFNDTTYFSRQGTDEICQKNLDGTGSVSVLVDTNCSSQYSQGVGNGLYATADYVYYACFKNKWVGRVKTDGTDHNPHFASIDSTCTPCGAIITSDGNWLYVANSAGQIRRIPIDGGSPDAKSRFSITGLGDVRGFTTDGTYLYWTSTSYPHRIGRANIDGTGVNSEWLDTQNSGTIWGVTATGSRLYWVSTAGQIGGAKLDGSDVNPTLVTGITDVRGEYQHNQVHVVGGAALPALAPALSNTAVPSVSGTATVGQALTADAGTWSATPSEVIYSWQVSGDSGATWSAASGSGATTDTYYPARPDIGKQVRVQVRAGATGGVLTTVHSADQAVAAPAPLPSTTLYWAGNTSVGSAWINDTTGVAIPGGRDDSISSTCSSGDAFGWNSTTFYGRQDTDKICQKNIDGTGSATELVDTLCSTVRGNDGGYHGVGSLYVTDQYLYYNCSVNTWIGRVDVDGQNNIRHFADGSGVLWGHAMTGDPNWLYSYGGNAIYRTAIDGGPSQVIVNNTGDVRGITTDGTYLYWVSTSYSNRIGRAKLDGTDQNNTWLDTQNSGYIWGLTATGSRLYWAARTGSEGQVGSAKLDGSDINPTLVAGISDMTHATNRTRVHVAGGTPLPSFAAALTNTAVPTISGTPEVGQALTSTVGTWSATPSQAFYLWQVSGDGGVTWSPAPGANGQSTYTPVISDIGKTVRLKVRAGATGGLLTTEHSAATVAVAAPPAPVNDAAPTVTVNGLFRIATPGAWTESTGNITYTYQWQTSASGAPGSWASATGPGNATAAYVTQTGDVGQYVRVEVTAFNGSTATAYSASTQVAAPSTLSRIYVKEGSLLADGSSLQPYASTDSWAFSSNGTTNVWGRGDGIFAAPADGTAPPASIFQGSYFFGVFIDAEYIYFTTGAQVNGHTYIQRMKIDGTELNSTFIDTNTATAMHFFARDAHYIYYHRGPGSGNAIGRAPITGGTGETFVDGLPRGVAGIAVDGDHVYWTYYNSDAIGRTDVSGSDVQASWIAHPAGSNASNGNQGIGVDQNGVYYVIQDGANSGVGIASLDGTATQRIATISSIDYGLAVIPGVPVGAKPANQPGGEPGITGTAGVGNTLTAAHGTWSNTPESYTYRWFVKDHIGGTWTAATGASGTTSSYVIPAGYGGKDLRVRVIAHNGATWSEPAYSELVTVAAPAPSNTAVPAITGTQEVGQALSASTGTWDNAPADASGYAYQWQVSDDGNAPWVDATGDGAATNSYTVALADDNKYLRVKVTATNDTDSTIAYSTATSAIGIPAPVNTAAPSISGNVGAGEVLTATAGTWNAYATQSPTYQWQVSDDGVGSWNNASGDGNATSAYTVADADAGKYLRVVVTAHNRQHTTDQASDATTVVIGHPDNTALPAISGTAAIGQQLTASHGTWTNAGTYAYEWQVSADGSTGWATASGSGANTASYTVAAADAGKYLRVVVTASNSLFETDQESAATLMVPTPPAPAPSPTPEPPVVAAPQAAPAPVVVAPGITVGDAFNSANLNTSTPAAASDVLKAAQINLPASATITYVLPLPKGLRLAGGKLVADTPGTYVVRVKVTRKNGKVGTRRVKIKVG